MKTHDILNEKSQFDSKTSIVICRLDEKKYKVQVRDIEPTMKDKTSTMTSKEIIKQTFLKEYKRLIDKEFYFISFSLIAVGIEFLGACLDENPFLEEGHSKKRFNKAIKHLFDKKYHQLELYENLRCGFAHVLLPGKGIDVIQQSEIDITKGKIHLGKYKNRLVLVSQEFYEDFAKACEEIIKRIDNKLLLDEKVYRELLNPQT